MCDQLGPQSDIGDRLATGGNRATLRLPKSPRRRPVAALGFLLFLLVAALPAARAQGSQKEERPVPTNLDDLSSPTKDAATVDTTRPRRLPPPPHRKPQLSYQIRSEYFNRANVDGSESVAWALGGNLNFWSDYYRGVAGVGAELFTSQPLYAPQDEGGTGLLTPNQQSITVLGQAYARIKIGSERLSLYRQALNLPYVDGDDSRMIPNTFEAYGLSHATPQKLNYALGYVDRIKPRDSASFQSMAEVAGAKTSKGMWLATLTYTDRKFTLGAINEYVPDTFNTFYAEATFQHPLRHGRSLGFGLQYTDQASVGDNLLPGSPFHTGVVSGRLAWSARNLLLTLAGATTGPGANIMNPYGKYPGYVSLMQEFFNRAGEDAVLVSASYDFTSLGMDGVRLFLGFGYGSGAIDPATRLNVPNRTEFEVTADWRPSKGPWKNYWLRLRYSDAHFTGGASGGDGYQPNLRLILNYDANMF
jgi:hypothetical protein